MKGLGKWTRAVVRRTITRRARLKTQRKTFSDGKSLLSEKERASNSGESAAVHYAQLSLLGFGDGTKASDDDPAVVKTMETLTVVGNDVPTSVQEKETRSTGGIPSR